MRLIATLALTALALPLPERAPRPTPHAARWLGMRAPDGAHRLLHGVAAAEAADDYAARCGAPPAWGARIERGGCGARPLPAALRLRLGLRLDLNAAPLDDLQQIRGVGPKTAARIIAARPFQSVEALVRVKGIGPKRLARWRGALSVGRGGAPPDRGYSGPPPRGSDPAR